MCHYAGTEAAAACSSLAAADWCLGTQVLGHMLEGNFQPPHVPCSDVKRFFVSLSMPTPLPHGFHTHGFNRWSMLP